MPSRPDPLAVRFCRALAMDTGGRPQQWRVIMAIAARASLRDDQVTHAVTYAVAAGWLIVEGGHSVALTDAGRRMTE